MKKILSITISFILFFSLCSCGNSNTTYQELTSHTKEEFLMDLQKALEERWDENDSNENPYMSFKEEIEYYKKLVNIEYKHLHKYFVCDFGDKAFNQIATDYLSAIQGQYEICTNTSIDQEQFVVKWDEYYSARMQNIKNLYENHQLKFDTKYNNTLYNLGIKSVPAYLLPLQGEWKSINSNWHIIINGDIANLLYYENYGDIVDSENYILRTITEMDSNNIYTVDNYTYFINTDGFLETHKNDNNPITNYYEKVSDITKLPQIIVKKAPYIGMPKDELVNSSWGIPKKVNRDTTVNGIKEQWVYDRPYNRTSYVYVTNGIVTAIQER